VEIFKEQITQFKTLLTKAGPGKDQSTDIDYLLALGEVLTLVAYGQLVLESRRFFNVDDDLVDEIFDFMVRDFSKYALAIYSKPGSTAIQRQLAMAVIRHPVTDEARFNRVWEQHVYAMKGQYAMRD
jgi:acyl-CoA dehydrogenase